MRKAFFALISVAAAVAVVSCAKEADKITENPAAKGVTINVISGEDGASKTAAVDGTVPSVQWLDTDKVRVFEVVDDDIKGSAESNAAVISSGKASFSTTLTWADAAGSSYKYAAVYPSNAILTGSSKYYLYLPEVQNLEGNNFSADSDILFSLVNDHGSTRVADAEDVLFTFRRLGTVVRLTLKGITAGEKIRQVTLTAPEHIAGTIEFDPVTGTVDPATAFTGYAYDTITLNVDNIVATGSDVVWFRVMCENDWAAGDYFDINVATDKNVYSKTVTIPTDMKFPDGGVTKLGVSLGSSKVAPLDVPYSEDFESGYADGWFFIDSDGDGYVWGTEYGIKTTSGGYALASASYINNVGPVTPDNWAFTPAVQLTTDNYVSFWVGAQDTDWKNEHYAVYIAETVPYIDDLSTYTTLIPETVFPSGDFIELYNDGNFEHVAVKIPSTYDGKVVYIGFRHFNCTDFFWINLDDVSIVEGMPSVTSTVTYGDYLGQWDTPAGEVINIEEKVDGVSYSISGLTGQGTYPVEAEFAYGLLILKEQVVSTSGDVDIVLQGTDGSSRYDYFSNLPIQATILRACYMGGNLTIIADNCFDTYLWVTYTAQSYTDVATESGSIFRIWEPHVDGYLYKESFEAGAIGWSYFDSDGDGYSWMPYIYSSYAHTGEGFLWGFSYNSGTSFYPDNWAFTPAITLTSGNYLSYWEAGMSTSYPDHFGVYITTNVPSDSNLDACVLLDERDITSDSFTQHVIQIPATYDGQTVYIGFRHFNSDDMYYVFIDDVAVTISDPSASASPAPAYRAAATRVNGDGPTRMGGVSIKTQREAIRGIDFPYTRK